MFKLKEFDSSEQRLARMVDIKNALENLAYQLSMVRFLRIDFNANAAERWDFILTSEFDSWNELEAYSSHPEHIAIVNELISPVRIDRACVDYINS
jgi:hypothetical protein